MREFHRFNRPLGRGIKGDTFPAFFSPADVITMAKLSDYKNGRVYGPTRSTWKRGR